MAALTVVERGEIHLGTIRPRLGTMTRSGGTRRYHILTPPPPNDTLNHLLFLDQAVRKPQSRQQMGSSIILYYVCIGYDVIEILVILASM